jgi:hypothetical protein
VAESAGVEAIRPTGRACTGRARPRGWLPRARPAGRKAKSSAESRQRRPR